MLKRRLTELRKEITELEADIQDLESNGLERPKEIYLFRNCVITSSYGTTCVYCGGYADYDSEFLYSTEPNLNGNRLCDNCAHKMAVYLTTTLVPWIRNNRAFYDDMEKQYPNIVLPASESRVPQIITFLSKAIKLKAFT